MIALYDAVNALQAEAGNYSEGVRIWMRIMAASYFAGIFFIPWRREAAWVVLMAVLTFVFLVMGKMLDPTLTRSFLGSVIHLVLWPLTLLLLWTPEARNRRRDILSHKFWSSAYSSWLIWVTSLVLISLVLDAKFLLFDLAAS